MQKSQRKYPLVSLESSVSSPFCGKLCLMTFANIRSYGLIALLTLGQAVVLLAAVPVPDRDNQFYQAFIESLAAGKLDLSIHGFHGAGFFAVIWQMISPSSLSHIYFQMLCALFIPFLAFLAGRAVFRDERHGLLLACGFAMMPFWWLVSLIGYTGASYTCALLLTLLGAAGARRWTFLPWAVAILIKPFAVVLLPVMIVLWKRKKDPKDVKDARGAKDRQMLWLQICLGLALPALYAVAQYLQIGHLIVGVHLEFSEANIWQSPRKIFLNGAYALQILFSVHNFHFPNPAGTGQDNMLHTSPLLMVSGLWAIVERKTYFTDRALPLAFLVGALLCFALNAIIGTMDHYYMQAGVLLLVLASVPVLLRHGVWISIVLATLHFQWFYFALHYGTLLQLRYVWLLPLIVDTIFVVWAFGKRREFRSFFA